MHKYLARSKLRTYRFMTAHCSSYTPTEINYCKTAIAFLWDNYRMAEARRAVSYLEFYEDCGGEISA
jgi:hypothetical protein